MPAEVYYLLASGGAEGFEAGSMLEIGRKQTLRTRNPAESTFGSFRLAAKLGAGNLYPHNEALVPPFLGGVRTNDAVRTPELIEGFDEQSRQRIFERLMIDRGASLDRKDHKDALNAVKKAARNAQKAGNREEAERLYEEVAQLEEGFKVDGDKHVPIQNLFSGYEYFPEGTAFDHRLSLTGASIEDVGTTLAALRAGAAQPRLGGHWHHDCGWVRTEYTIKIKPTGDYGPATIAGRLIIDPIDGFELDSDDPLLLKALDIYDRQAQAGFPDWSGMREGSGLTALNKVPKKGNGKADKTEAA